MNHRLAALKGPVTPKREPTKEAAIQHEECLELPTTNPTTNAARALTRPGADVGVISLTYEVQGVEKPIRILDDVSCVFKAGTLNAIMG